MKLRIPALVAVGLLMPAFTHATALPTKSATTSGVPILQQTVDSHSLQLVEIDNQLSMTNASVGQLIVDNDKQNVALGSISSSLQSQEISIQDLTDNYNNVQLSVNSLATKLASVEGKVKQLSEKLDSTTTTPPVDFSFFTNRQIGYGNYIMSSAFDAKDYTKFSMTFTCTSQTNDEVKYWIETSADGTNWSPYGYYVVRCNGIYGGASMTTGQVPAR